MATKNHLPDFGGDMFPCGKTAQVTVPEAHYGVQVHCNIAYHAGHAIQGSLEVLLMAS